MSLKRFSNLIQSLSAESNEQLLVRYLNEYFQECPNKRDKDCALQLLLNKYPSKMLQAKQLASWTAEITGFPTWLVERSELEVGSTVKTLALLIQKEKDEIDATIALADLIIQTINLHKSAPEAIKDFLTKNLRRLSPKERLFILKLLTGSYRSPASEQTVLLAIAGTLQINYRTLCLRLYYLKQRTQINFAGLQIPIQNEASLVPINFPEIKAVDHPPKSFRDQSEWIAFGKRPGILVQVLKSGNTIHLWNEQFGIISNKFPEILQQCAAIGSDFHLFGQIIVVNPADDVELLVNRIKKKTVTTADLKKCKAELEVWQSYELTESTDSQHSAHQLMHAKSLSFSSRQQLEDIHLNCRESGFKGIMLQKKGEIDQYYFWKASSYSIRALLMYIEFGSMSTSGIRALTFGLMKGEELVPIAKVESLPDEQVLNTILEFVKENTLERFGPVRTVTPTLVYELFFDEISPSARHKSKVKLENVRLGKKINANAENASTFSELESLL